MNDILLTETKSAARMAIETRRHRVRQLYATYAGEWHCGRKQLYAAIADAVGVTSRTVERIVKEMRDARKDCSHGDDI